MRDDGGPAFPAELRNNAQARAFGAPEFSAYQGMTTRDYFAAKAMAALVDQRYYEADTVSGIEAIAANAYAMADAMIAERNKGQ